MLKKAKVYLLDEPASGSDPLAGSEFSALLKKLASEGAAILMASHDIFRVREVSRRRLWQKLQSANTRTYYRLWSVNMKQPTT
jgi:ABC-type Mn2+/Zn2+ transport system ATPase subunit